METKIPKIVVDQTGATINERGLSEQAKKAEADAKNALKKANAAQSHSELNRSILLAVTVGSFVAMIGLLITVGAFLNDTLAMKQATYQSLVDEVNEQSNKIDLLYQQHEDDTRPIQVNVSTAP